MNTTTRRLLGGLAIAAVLGLGQGGPVIAASPTPLPPPPSGPTGDEMLSVQPSLISVTARPGATASIKLTLRAAADLDVTITSRGLAQGTDGSYHSVPDAEDTSAYSARTMISATPGSVRVKPGDVITVNVSLAVPADVGEGTRYGILNVTGLPAGAAPSSNVGFGVELGVSTIVQIADTAQTKTGEIKDITIGEALPGQPLPVTVSFLNTGTTHYGAVPNELITTSTLQDASGALLASASANGTQLSVVPTFFRDVALSMTPSTALVSDASYYLEVGVGLKDGTVFDRKALDFTWSGGGVLSATSTPVQVPPVDASGQPSELTIIAIAALLGAMAAVVLIWAVSRRRRRPGTVDAATEP